jgi:transcriptional regulator with XRE-family HTH domain
MAARTDNLRFILGLKLRTLRQERDQSLKDVAAVSGLSVSYLSEIEKGKKYPKPDKLIDLARAFDVPYDELVSLSVTDELDPLKEVFTSTLIQEFPFQLFGLAPQDVFGLVSDQPVEAGALIRTFLEIGRTYDMQVEHFLFAALRSYQQMHANYFEGLEQQAAAYRAAHDWPHGTHPDAPALRTLLESKYGYRIDTETLPNDPDLSGFRSVYTDEEGPMLFINGDLTPIQKAFIYGREVGYQELDVEARATTSSWLKAESFEQVLNNFKASYFSGALLIDRSALIDDLEALFEQSTWSNQRFLDCVARYPATPEMFFYRLTELVPHAFGLDEIFFMRFHHKAGTDDFQLTKVLNMSDVAVPHGLGPREHYCRRWPAMYLLRDLAKQQAHSSNGAAGEAPVVRAQRSHFIDNDAAFFVVSAARPLSLTERTNSCVSLGFLMTDAFMDRVQFADDPDVSRLDVNLTCERCPLPSSECAERAAPPSIYDVEQRQARQEAALDRLMQAVPSTDHS